MCVFRQTPPEAEPFGLWFSYFVVPESNNSGIIKLQQAGTVAFVWVQNSVVWKSSAGASPSGIRQLIQHREWAEEPRDEVFFAPYS